MRPVREKKDVCNIYENPIPYVLIGNSDKLTNQLLTNALSKYSNLKQNPKNKSITKQHKMGEHNMNKKGGKQKQNIYIYIYIYLYI